MPIIGTIASSYLQATGDFVSLASATGNGSSTSFLFSNIPQTYSHLQIRYWGKSTWAPGTISDVLTVRINEDTSQLYRVYSVYTGVGPSMNFSDTGTTQNKWGDIFLMLASNSPAYVGGVGVLDIYNYSSTTMKKSAKFVTADPADGYYNGNYWNLGFGSAQWNSNSAITQLRFMANGAFTSDSYVALYGIRT